MASKVHKVRYYNPKPLSIHCVSFNRITKQIALARNDASIEIWDLKYAPLLLKFIPGVENGSIEALGWVHERLLLTGLGGALVEWDLNKLSLKSTVLLTGYAAWCLDVNTSNTLVAVGTEQGYVNLFSVENNEIEYRKIFDKQEGRIMCCKFNKAGNILVTGSINSIRVWNVETGQAMSRMSTSRKGQETIIWCLAVLSDNTIVSGESKGRLTFWDITTGDQIESFMTHKADILAVAVSEDETSLFCSGVDPLIVHFLKVETSKNKTGLQWVKHVPRHIHEHDVRALAIHGEKLLSFGVDGYMTMSSYPPKWVLRIPHMLPTPRTSVCASKKLLLLKYTNHLEVWKLGSYATDESGSVIISHMNTKENQNPNDSLNTSLGHKQKNQQLKLIENPLKLASVQTKGHEQLRCCEISPDGALIVYSTGSHIRMLKLEMDDESTNISLSKILITGLSVSFCDRMTFTEDSRTLLLHSCGTVYVIQVDLEAGATVTHTIPTEKKLQSTLLHLEASGKCSSGMSYLVAADTAGSVAVWARCGRQKFDYYLSLPRYHCVPSALHVDEGMDTVVIAYVDQKLVEYDLVKKKFNDWPNKSLPPVWFLRNLAVKGISAHPQRKHALVFHDETSLAVLDRSTSIHDDHGASGKKMKKRNQDSLQTEPRNASLQITNVKYLAGFHWLGPHEAAMVEVLAERIVAQLPSVLSRKLPPVL